MTTKKLIPEKYKMYRHTRHPANLYVSPDGVEKWSGGLPEPNANRSDGPFNSIQRAQKSLREHKTPGPVTVWLRAGRYVLDEPLLFTAEDSTPVTFAAYHGEEVIIDGGCRIDGWKKVKIGGIAMWKAEVPEVAAGKWYFRQLFVDGQRRSRSALPKKGTFVMENVPDTTFEGFMSGEPADCFYAARGDFRSWQNIKDVDVVAYHYWNEERMPVVSFDPKTRRVQCARKSVWPLKDDAAPRYARYRVENVREALTEPGEWYLDRKKGIVYYIPLPGEKIGEVEVCAPRIPRLVTIRGDKETGQPARNISFRGIRFRNTSWYQSGNRAGYEQAALNVPGVISLENAQHCCIEDCTISNVGFYGIELGHGCSGNRVAGNTITDMGAGGVKCIGVDVDAPAAQRTHGNIISDNEIAHGGKVFASAVGVLIVHSFSNDVVHNHIHHLEYSGISCGWVWGYGASATRDNLIAKNHIHHLGSGLLNDMGGIYTLGEQPGTILRNNLIHDIRMHNYGGWAIYADEGSSYLLIEGNVCCNTDSELFQLHYGRENIIRNNIFAFSKLGHVSLTITQDENAFTFTNNIVIVRGKPVFLARNRESLDRKGFRSDLNLFWDVSGRKVHSANQHRNDKNRMVTSKRYSMADMRKLGYDVHSIVADPGCRDVKKRDFRLKKSGPTSKIGFVEPDLSDIGPR